MAKINRPVLKNALDMIENQLADYMDSIDEAYCRHPDDDLAVSLTVKFRPAPEGQIKIVTNIGFVESRVKDSSERLVDPQQRSLFEDQDAA